MHWPTKCTNSASRISQNLFSFNFHYRQSNIGRCLIHLFYGKEEIKLLNAARRGRKLVCNACVKIVDFVAKIDLINHFINSVTFYLNVCVLLNTIKYYYISY